MPLLGTPFLCGVLFQPLPPAFPEVSTGPRGTMVKSQGFHSGLHPDSELCVAPITTPVVSLLPTWLPLPLSSPATQVCLQGHALRPFLALGCRLGKPLNRARGTAHLRVLLLLL